MTSPEPGTTARRTRTVTERDIELFTALDGSAVVWRDPDVAARFATAKPAGTAQ
jgi:hypothetical protein